MISTKQLLEIVARMAEVIRENKDFLTELDMPIGDSDHGINLARGFTAVEAKLPTVAEKDIGTILKTVGMTLVSTVGGASGPLYGTAFMKAVPYRGPEAPPTVESRVIPADLRMVPASLSARVGSFSLTA